MKAFAFLPLLPWIFIPLHADHAITHAWTMPTGNLISNWSFENELDAWKNENGNGILSKGRASPVGFAAASGAFVGKVSGTTSTDAEILRLRSAKIPLVSSQAYTLSFLVRSEGSVGNGVAPEIRFYRSNTVLSRLVSGADYASFSGGVPPADWTLYVLRFTTGPDETQADLSLWRTAASGVSATLYFDDVVLQEGDFDAAGAAGRRNLFGYSETFSDGLGRIDQIRTRIPEAPSSYRVEGTEYDSGGRPVRNILPVVESGAALRFDANLAQAAIAYYNGSTAPDAGGYPFAEMRYAPEADARLIRSSAPGNPWRLEGPHHSEDRFYFVPDLQVPNDVLHLSADPHEREYGLRVSQDPDSGLSLSWTNRKGQTVQAARRVSANSWNVTRWEYYPSGNVRRVLTPLDVSSGDSAFAEIRNYNAAGLLSSRYSRDRGLEKFWYNKRGALRYSQDERLRRQSGAAWYAYYDYDATGNLLSTGMENRGNTLDQRDVVDGDGRGDPDGISKIEIRGYLYGDLDSFQARTGIPLDSIFYPMRPIPISRQNALVAAYNTNRDSRVPGFPSARKYVADFYAYDEKGRVSGQYKYLGAMDRRDRRLQSVAYAYDDLDRLVGRTVRDGGSPDFGGPDFSQSWSYDGMGRVSAATSMGGEVARYDYGPRGSLDRIHLGSAVETAYEYNVRGWLKGLSAENGAGRQVYRQALGYDEPALSGSDAPARPLYGGQITQQIGKFTAEVPNPVRSVNYAYDALGRMITSDLRRGSGLNDDESLRFPLSLATVEGGGGSFEYDGNGRILGRRAAGVAPSDSARYVYPSGSYRLNHVLGKLSPDGTRDASSPDNFIYDASGDLIRDDSKGLEIRYGFDGVPSGFRVRHEESERETVLYPFYDAAGSRVSQVELSRLSAGFPVLTVGTAEGAETAELYQAATVQDAYDLAYEALHRSAFSPDSVTIYVVQGAGFRFPVGNGSYGPLEIDLKKIPVKIRGIEKYGPAYDSLVLQREGRKMFARHDVDMGSGVLSEIQERYGSDGGVAARKVLENVYGAGSMIGRYDPDAGTYGFYVKNHLGSTVRVVNGDGSYAASPVYDYGPYGEIKAVREDSLNPVTEKFTGKEFDTTLALDYFGARWYDPELGMWTSPDAAGQYANPYSYAGGDPLRRSDPDGLRAIFVNGIGGEDGPEFRKSFCAAYPDQCGENAVHGMTGAAVADYGHDYYGRSRPWVKWGVDLPIAFLGVPTAFTTAPQVYRSLVNSYKHARADGEGFYVFAHSGGDASSGLAVAGLNWNYGYGAVKHRYTYAGVDALWLGTGLSSATGTRTTSYYNGGDYTGASYYGAAWDATNPVTLLTDPAHNWDALNPGHWCAQAGHDPVAGCRTLNDVAEDHWYLGGEAYKWGLAKPADHVFSGLGNGFYNYFSLPEMAHAEYGFWNRFDWSDPSDYGDAVSRYGGLRTGYKLTGDVKDWLFNN